MKGRTKHQPAPISVLPDSEPVTRRNTEASYSGREHEKRDERPQPRNSVVEREINMNSEGSFPASDPPSWSPTTAGSPPNGEEPPLDD